MICIIRDSTFLSISPSGRKYRNRIGLRTGPWGTPHNRETEMYSYQTALQYLWPLQSHCDAVEKDKDQNHIVKELVGDNGLAEHPEPSRRLTEERRRQCQEDVKSVHGYMHSPASTLGFWISKHMKHIGRFKDLKTQGTKARNTTNVSEFDTIRTHNDINHCITRKANNSYHNLIPLFITCCL